MARAIYKGQTEAAVSLSASTAKSVLGVASPAQFGVDLLGFSLGFTSVTSTDQPVLVEVCTSTFATNGIGTNSTSGTVRQQAGQPITAGFTTGYNWTSEPTVLVAFETFTLTPNGGTFIYDWPYGESPDNAVSTGFVIRCTPGASATALTARATLRFARC